MSCVHFYRHSVGFSCIPQKNSGCDAVAKWDPINKQTNKQAEERRQRHCHLCKALLAPSGRAADSRVSVLDQGGGGPKVPVAELWVTTRGRVEDGGGRLEVTPAGQSLSMTDGEVSTGQIQGARRKETDSMMCFCSNVTQPVREDEGDPVQMAQESTGVYLYV